MWILRFRIFLEEGWGIKRENDWIYGWKEEEKKKEIELFKYVNSTANSAHEQYKDLPNTSNQLSISFEYIEHRYKDSFLYKKY